MKNLLQILQIADNLILLPSIRKKNSDWGTILSTLAKLYTVGIPIKWTNFHRFSNAKKVDLPGYIFEETSHWLNIGDGGTTPFHPLLGSYIPNASENAISESRVNVKRVPFLKDHLIGDKIIFPCAGYMDMCMTAAYADSHCEEGSYTKPSGALALNHFEILTPVCLNETQDTEFQVKLTSLLNTK